MHALHLLAQKSMDWLVQPGGGIWQQSSSDQKQREFVTITLIATSLVLLIWLISRIQGRLTSPQIPRRRWHVFWSLLKHHGVGPSDRLLLSTIVCCQRIKQPTVLLLSPGLYSRHAMQWLSDSRLASLWPNAKQRLTRVARQVFTEDVHVSEA